MDANEDEGKKNTREEEKRDPSDQHKHYKHYYAPEPYSNLPPFYLFEDFVLQCRF
jgi:hypothetical protein